MITSPKSQQADNVGRDVRQKRATANGDYLGFGV